MRTANFELSRSWLTFLLFRASALFVIYRVTGPPLPSVMRGPKPTQAAVSRIDKVHEGGSVLHSVCRPPDRLLVAQASGRPLTPEYVLGFGIAVSLERCDIQVGQAWLGQNGHLGTRRRKESFRVHVRPSSTYPPPTKHKLTMSAPSLAPYILARPWLKSWMMPLANWYANAAGYRRLGR